MNKRSVFVIIVTYNGCKWINACLSSLRESTEPCIPIIVDNCSSDDTIAFIKKTYPEAIIIQNTDNKGFGQANNQGIEYAYRKGATHFFLLNQDAYVEPDTIKVMADIQDESGIAVISPMHLNGEGILLDRLFFEYSVISEHNRDLVSDILLNRTKDYYPVKFINAAAWMLSRECVEEIGGFDPLFFLYAEDSNYCQRLIYHDKQIAVTPRSFIRHDRIEHGNNKAYTQRFVLSMLLKTYGDINQPFFKITKNRIVFHLWMLKEFFTKLLNRDFNASFTILNGYISYLKLIPKLSKSRLINKQRGHNYLVLEKEMGYIDESHI